MSTRTYGDGSCDNVFHPSARPTAGMHAAVKPETDVQLHARINAAARQQGYSAPVTVRTDGEAWRATVGAIEHTAFDYRGLLRSLETSLGIKK